MTALAALRPIDLATLDAVAPLRVRADRKYVLEAWALDALLEGLAGTHAALELDGSRCFAYDSVYFDTPGALMARAHVQRRRRRFKCRTRLYVDAGTCALEVKTRDGRGATVKHRLAYDPADHGTLTAAAEAFVAAAGAPAIDLRPALRTRYARTTLVAPGERVTVDRDVRLGAARLRDGLVIVEAKSAGGAGLADRELRRLGARPVSLSKYLVGAGMTHMAAPPNDVRRLSYRYFERCAAPAW